jgi:L,D-transpeptidase-like protein
VDPRGASYEIALRSSLAAAVLLAAGCSEQQAGGHAAGTAPIAAVTQAVEIPAAPPGPATTTAPPTTAAPRVDEAKPAPAPGARIYAKARFAWIQAQPRSSNGWLGYLSLGGSAPLRGGSVESARVTGGSGCNAWYAIEPRGFVCDGDTASVDPDDPVVRALAADAPKTDSPWPYEYAESMGAPRYVHAPTPAEQRSTEWDLDAHQKRITAARAGEAVDKSLIGVDLAPAGVPMPELFAFTPLVREARPFVAPGSTVAYTRAFDNGDRAFLLAHDKALIPRDRVRPYPRSTFHGVEIGGDVALPIAFFRRIDRPKYKKGDDGVFVKTGESWPRLAWVALTGAQETSGKQAFLATKEPGVFVLESDASVIRQASPPPGRPDPSSGAGRRTWLDISVLDGWLVAYEGMTPVYATLIAPGRGGVPYGDRDPLETASTPTGTFRVDGKFVTATMVSSTNDMIVHTEVQFVQNFHGPHALHGAYWHDAWGEQKSGGCINLAPIDAKHVFEWSEPAMPAGWYGIRSVPEAGAATVVSVHK